jgi:hypothetical protein
MRRALVALALALGIATAPTIYALDLRDDRLPAQKAERYLQNRVGTHATLVCRPVDEDRSSTIDDVDYFCEGLNAGYWVGSDEKRITEIQPAG